MTETIDRAPATMARTRAGSGVGEKDRDRGAGGRVDGAGPGRGASLVGPGGLLAGLTKRVLESVLEAEMTEHVGYGPHDPAGHHWATPATGPGPRR